MSSCLPGTSLVPESTLAAMPPEHNCSGGIAVRTRPVISTHRVKPLRYRSWMDGEQQTAFGPVDRYMDRAQVLIGHQLERIPLHQVPERCLQLHLRNAHAQACVCPTAKANPGVWCAFVLLARRQEALRV